MTQPAVGSNEYDPTRDLQEDLEEEQDRVLCWACGGTGLVPEGWDCEECDGYGDFPL